MNICVVGYYGMGNFGDELFLETLKQIFFDHNVFAWQGSVDVSQIDAVIIGGGDIIAPYAFNKYYFPDELKGHPTWIYGVGVVRHYPEETWPKDQVAKNRERIKTAIRFVVRDKNSAEVAKKIGLHDRVECLPDLAFSYRQSSIYPIDKSRYKKLIGVCVYSYSSYPLETMAALLTDYAKNGYQLIFIPMVNQNNDYSDVLMCKLLREKIEEEVGRNRTLLLAPQYNLELIYSWIHSLDYFISSKLHPSLVALMGGIPVLCLSDQGKVSSLMERYGLDDYALNIGISQDELREKMSRFILEGKEKAKAALPLIQQTIEASNQSLLELKKEIETYIATN